MNNESEIVKKIADAISEITGISAEKIHAETSLSDCGIHSMGFVELLVTAKRLWNVDLVESGLTASDVETVGALASRIQSELEKNG